MPEVPAPESTWIGTSNPSMVPPKTDDPIMLLVESHQIPMEPAHTPAPGPIKNNLLNTQLVHVFSAVSKQSNIAPNLKPSEYMFRPEKSPLNAVSPVRVRNQNPAP